MYGFAGGILVHFEVRGGRLRDWRARACNDEAEARSLAATTPAVWAAFTVRNAALAARLGSKQSMKRPVFT